MVRVSAPVHGVHAYQRLEKEAPNHWTVCTFIPIIPWLKVYEYGERKMLKLRILPLLVVAAFALLVRQAPAHAQQARTWVSGAGNDVGVCNRAAPCKTFNFAQTQTAAGGEIFALDRGEFDGLTINKAITIDGGSQNASVHSTTATAITVAANPSDVVIIRNLHVRGDGDPNGNGAFGILFSSGALLSIEGCTISGTAITGIGAGLANNGGASATLNVIDTTITDAGNGIFLATAAPCSARPIM
jgi:nitrous oxidase accessory protein NosD